PVEGAIEAAKGGEDSRGRSLGQYDQQSVQPGPECNGEVRASDVGRDDGRLGGLCVGAAGNRRGGREAAARRSRPALRSLRPKRRRRHHAGRGPRPDEAADEAGEFAKPGARDARRVQGDVRPDEEALRAEAQAGGEKAVALQSFSGEGAMRPERELASSRSGRVAPLAVELHCPICRRMSARYGFGVMMFRTMPITISTVQISIRLRMFQVFALIQPTIRAINPPMPQQNASTIV